MHLCVCVCVCVCACEGQGVGDDGGLKGKAGKRGEMDEVLWLCFFFGVLIIHLVCHWLVAGFSFLALSAVY